VRTLTAGCTRRTGIRPFRPCPGFNLPLLLGCVLPCLVPAAPARAHHQTASHTASADEISIPTISHGQMVVLAENRTAILDLAARQIPTDRVMRRLQGYIAIQFSACLWGLVPGSLTDEDSPFNECTHAYLAATRALLMHLQDMPGDRAPVRALADRIETEMLRRQASLVMCRYSDESFSTSEVIYPDWSLLRAHVPGLVLLMTVLLTLAGGALAIVRWKPGMRLRRAARQNAGESRHRAPAP
jgi:hypothetical protein